MPQRTPSSKMAARSHMTAEIWSLILEIIHLLSGQTYPDAQPGDHVTVAVSPPPSLAPDRHTLQKILEVTRNVTELLIREIESPLELCLEVKVENEMEGENGDGSAAGDRCASSKEPYKQEESSHVIGADPGDFLINNVKTNEEEENVFVKIKEEENPLQISPDGTYSQNITEEHAAILSHREKEDDLTAESTGAPITPNPHLALPPADLSSHPSTPSACHTVSSPHHTVQTSNKQYSCAECGKCFSHKTNLIRHERVHTGEKPYSCSECGKCFFQKSNLINHERIHTEEKPYSCSECGKCFSQKSALIRHERVHTGGKPHSCSECGKSFSQKSNLIIHERVHIGEKPYPCSECGKCFSQKSNLISHERLHTGEKPYSCSQCGKCFSRKSALITHERVHTGEKPYECSECGKCFSDWSDHIRHQRLHTD